MPFIARWPGVIPAGRVDRDTVLTAVDMLPTFVELAGSDLPADYHPDGQSIVAALKGKTFSRTKPIFWEWAPANNGPITWPHLGIRDGQWKLLHNEKLGRTELYNIQQDWAEATDLSKSHPEIVQKLKNQIFAWKQTLPKNPPANCISKSRDLSKQ